MRIGYFECFCGISGDMTIGALVDAGVNAEAIRRGVASLELPCALGFDPVHKAGFRATQFTVQAAPEHAHRHLHQVLDLIERSSLSPRQKTLAGQIFRRLGEAEAAVHGVPIERVHFHEVGAVDSIADIVGAAIGLDLLGVDEFQSSPVPTGRGQVRGAHGVMPIPAPGVAELLKGVPLMDVPVEAELTTPTGAAILTTVVRRFGPMPPLRVERIGSGAGRRDLPDRPNILRLFVGTAEAPVAGGDDAGGLEVDRVWVLETNLDDLGGETVGYCSERLLAAGALDVFVTPVQMKKNRPGVILSVICGDDTVAAAETILFRETTTLGIRRFAVTRHKLHRRACRVPTPFGPIAGKLNWRGNEPPRFAPEYDDCARIAAERGLPLQEVYAAARAAAGPITEITAAAGPGSDPDDGPR